jgi:Tfp pilus assembly protein PilP
MVIRSAALEKIMANKKKKINTELQRERLEEYARKQLKMGIGIIEKNGRKSVVISRGRFEPKHEVNVL